MSTTEVETRTSRLDERARRALLESISVQIPQREVATGYRVGMILLAGAMAGLALGFLAMVGFLAWLGIWHLYNAVASLSAGPYFLFHLPMALLGLMLVLFLIKPIFLRPKGDEQQMLALEREKEPLLFEYVETLCKAVNAPMPEIIRVDCNANASAGVEMKWFGLMGRKCIVTIGLPLAAAMSVSQMTGILAHEMGHLTQRGGMLASNMVRRMTFFFGKVVFQRDRLDAMLARLRSNRNALGVLLYWVAVMFIEPARGVLWLMLLLGESLSTHFLRRMEFDADWLEAQIYGAGEFEKVSQDLLFLGIASNRAYRRMADSWEQRRLADDYPRLIVSEAKFLRTHHKELIEFLESQKTRWFDTHPCHSERVLNVRDLDLEASPRLVQVDLPAAALFTDFDDLCRRATHEMYRQILKEEVTKASYVPTSQMTAEFARQEKRFKVLDEFFAGQAGVEGPVFPQPAAGIPAPHMSETLAALQRGRADLAQAVQGMAPHVEQLQECNMKLAVAMAQQDLANLFPNNPQAQGLYRKANRLMRQQQQVQTGCRHRTVAFTAVAAQRFTLALQLAAHPDVAGKMKHGAAAQKLITRYLPLAHALRNMYPQVEVLLQQAVAVRILLSAHSAEQPYQPLVDRILTVTDFLLKATQKLRSDLDAFAYPFEHAITGIRVGQALTEEAAPRSTDPRAVHTYVMTCVERFHALAYRVCSQLATVAAAAESSLGLKPLPMQVEDDKHKKKQKRERSGLAEWLGYSARAAAGLLLLGTLLWWSFDPPALPSLSWGETSGSYRPAAFSTSVQHFNRYDPSAYSPPPRVASNYPSGAPNFGAEGAGGGGGMGPEGQPQLGMPFQAPRGAPQFTPRGAPPQMAVPAIPIPGQTVSPYTPYQPGRPNTPGNPGYPNKPGSPGYTGTPGVRQPGTPYTPPSYTPPNGGRYTPPTPPTYTPPTPPRYTPPTPPTYTPPRAPTGGGGMPGGGTPGGRGG